MLRHATTRWNTQGRRLGWADQPLTSAGRRAARTWALGRTDEFAAVVASDLGRARETGQILADTLGLGDITAFARLREQDQGAWTGLTKAQIKCRWPGRLRERPRRPVGGEPPEAVLARALGALEQIAAEHEGRRVLAVTHNGLIHALERALGVAAPPVVHLEGRWLSLGVPPRGGGEWGIRSVRAGELTAGRRALVSGASEAFVVGR
jgi:probable phosphoglycerate mutase